jgi:peptidoglycan/LPS O-acetylase OafA/YrhL
VRKRVTEVPRSRMGRALRHAVVVATWIVLWGGLGWIIGYHDHGHAWQILPMIGAVYGLLAGTLFAVLRVSRLAYHRSPITRAIGIGVLASIATIPPIWIVTGSFAPVVLVFFPIAGAMTGAATGWILRSEARTRPEPAS